MPSCPKHAADMKIALAAWQKAKVGEQPVVSDRTLNVLAEHFLHDDSLEAGIYFRCSSSIPNPDRCGMLDAYLLRLNTAGQITLAHLAAAEVA